MFFHNWESHIYLEIERDYGEIVRSEQTKLNAVGHQPVRVSSFPAMIQLADIAQYTSEFQVHSCLQRNL